MKKILCNLFILIFFISSVSATEFEELDKPPDGAHKDQMLFSFFICYGIPRGKFIDAEENFLKGSTYTFSDNDITKALEISHLSYSVGLSYEYMPIDYIGAAAKLRRSYVMQKTNFGQDYENWKGYLYRDISLHIGPALHATTRKRWDFILTPMIGFASSKYTATPVAKKILSGYSGDTRRKSNHLSYGAELNCTIYFSGGLIISLGGEWIRNRLDIGDSLTLTNPQTQASYKDISSGNMDCINAVISAGYALYN